jgi:atypical dual specificity phosphatase
VVINYFASCESASDELDQFPQKRANWFDAADRAAAGVYRGGITGSLNFDSEVTLKFLAFLIFYPTLAWNVLLGRLLGLRNWWDEIDDQIVLGALPFRRDVPELERMGIRAVVNTCQEYRGPLAEYAQAGIEQFRMPTVDFTHPQFDDICRAVEFIQRHADQGHRVYVHCKAGRARSATVVMCWLIKSLQRPAAEIQQLLLKKRPHVNPRVDQRPVVLEFERRYLRSGSTDKGN